MANINEIKYFTDIANDSKDADEIIKNATNIAMAAMSRDYSYTGMANKFSMDGVKYAEENAKIKKAILAFSGSQSGIKQITERKHLAYAFDNSYFVSIYNAIVAETLLGVIINTTPSQIMALANISDVDLGNSETFEITPKGFPIAQRNSYNNNVVVLDSYSTTAITVTPKVYSTGSTIDYTRILANNFDFGKEIASVAMSLLYAQFKLVVGILFDTTNLTGTPLYEATFAPSTYTLLISYLQMLNKSSVKAYGTIPGFQAMGAIATTNYGFETQDEMVRQGFLGRAYGIDNIAIDQATDLSAPFIDANLASLLLVPNNKIILASDIGDRPVKLVRENYIKVITKEPKAGSLYRQDYTYTMSFDAALCSQAHYAIQGV